MGVKCPVCGKHMFEEKDDLRVCPVCGWENDGFQISHPDKTGANHVSLNEARQLYKQGIEF